MRATEVGHVVNRLIDGLPRRARNGILARCEPVDMVQGATLCEADRRYRYIYFPLTGFISLVAPAFGHPPIEMGLIGNEGMLGATVALGVDAARLRGVVQGAGTALRLTRSQLRRELQRNGFLRRTIGRYLYVLLAQLTQTATCAHFHEIEARLARLLLLTHDRAHADHFCVTHLKLSELLGVQRSAVSIAAGALQRRELIHYSRGDITIVNRRGLELASCECYDAVIDDYRQLFAA